VLHAHHVLVGCRKAANCCRSAQALAHVQVARRFVEHVHVGLLHAHDRDAEPLQLATAELRDLPLQDRLEVEASNHFRQDVLSACRFGLQDLRYAALDNFGDLIHVLRLNHGLELVALQLREQVLQLAAAEPRDNIGPVGRCRDAEIWLELARQDLERGGLAHAVGAHQPQDAAGPGKRQAVQHEAVLAVAVRDLG
jgi:hypothetical protein